MTAATSDTPVPLAGLAPLLGRSKLWVERNIKTLRDKHGFPRPLPVVGLYDPAAVRAWKDRQANIGAELRVPAAWPKDLVPADIDWAAELDSRAVGLGGGARGSR